MTRSMRILLVGSALLAQLPSRAWGITWCHDYTFYRVTGGVKDYNRTGIEELRTWLAKHGYKSFSFTTAARDPQAQSKLKPGDVILFRAGNGHSAFVNDQGLIDHFIQTAGRSGTRYAPGDVAKQPNFHKNDRLINIVNYTHTPPTAEGATISGGTAQPYKNCPIEVWRNEVDLAGWWDARLGNNSSTFPVRINARAADGTWAGVMYYQGYPTTTHPGHFFGKLEGSTLRYTWYNDEPTGGDGELSFADGALTGRWRDTRKHNGAVGAWSLTRRRSAP